jgi:pimeloyl-ACP methyl ester carboxylesterase
MTCEKDSGSTPEMAQEIANDYNDSKMIIVPNLKHLGLMENPDAFVIPILKFLERKN